MKRSDEPNVPNAPFVLGYYPEWSTNLAPDAIDFSLFTHLCHAFAVVRKDGGLTLPDARQSRDLCARAHAKGVRVLLSVGGAESGPAFAAQTAGGTDVVARLADHLVKAMRQVGYDGLDIDWEFPASVAESARMSALVRALRERLPVGATLTMAAPATNWNGQWFDAAALLPALDFVNVMTYDFHGGWSPRAGYNAPLYASPHDPDTRAVDTVSGAVDYWQAQKRWPAEKMLLGIPLYGRGFRAAHWGDKPSGTFAGADDLTYNVIQGLVKQGWHRATDVASKTPTLRSPDGTKLISYDDADSVAIKGAYARSRKLGGVFFWDISNDFDGRSNPLVRAARKGLL